MPDWSLPPKNLLLKKDRVHVWRADLDAKKERWPGLWPTLSPDEQSRADRFHFRRDRERFIIGRGVLRAILARYLDTAPGHLRFDYNPYGKPALPREIGGEIQFNLSHSHGLALYGITRRRQIGLDLEYIRPIPEAEQLAARFFSALENEIFQSLPADQKTEAFFNCWTRKEAYLKARGEGLSLPLAQFDVSLAPGQAAALLNVRGEDVGEAARWSLQSLLPAPGYIAAVAVEGHDWDLTCWQWPE